MSKINESIVRLLALQTLRFLSLVNKQSPIKYLGERVNDWMLGIETISEGLCLELEKHLQIQLKYFPWRQVRDKLRNFIYPGVIPESTGISCCWADYYFSVVNGEGDRFAWEAFKALVSSCGWVYPFEKVCVVCDRPHYLSFDAQNRLHAEGSPAIQFADGFSVYAYHGVRLPEEYGKFHPDEWRSEWLLSETNAEIKRVLIQGIGYDRLCQELQATELDVWREYALLKIEGRIDVEPIYLLKMTCPSTGYIHALRVPPAMISAREAIRWVNWGVDPEEFSMET